FLVLSVGCGDKEPPPEDCRADASCEEEPQGECEGVPDGTLCGEDTGDACVVNACHAGACVAQFADTGTACGDSSSSACDAPDTCDGAGTCLSNWAPADTACGDPSSSACDAPESCDGLGACQPNPPPAATACGVGHAMHCDAADTCDGVDTCQSNVADDGASCYDCLQGAGNCDACSAGVCADGEICQEPAQASVTTTHAAGNNHRGNMFDIIATNTIKIVSLDVSPMRATEVEVYFRPGSYQGHVPSPDGWTLIGSAQVPLAAPETLVPLPLTIDVTIPAGETYGFYVTSTNTEIALHYSNGTSE